MGKGGGRKKKGPKFLPDGTPMTNKAKKQASRAERAAEREKAAKKLMEEAAKKAKEEAAKKKKNGGKKGSSAKKEAAPVLVGGPRKVGRGHRQKGGGAVRKSRGEIFVPSADMWRKEAERFPSELLQQYCQKNKLPRPKFTAKDKNAQGGAASSAGEKSGQFTGRVIMADPKGKKEKDRFFYTRETFAAAGLAKQNACLLVRCCWCRCW